MIGILLGHSFDDKSIEDIYNNNDKNYCIFSTGAVSPKYPVPYLQKLRVYDFKGTVVATSQQPYWQQGLVCLPRSIFTSAP